MRFRILGPLEVSDGDRLLTVGAAKQRALLAALLLRANQVVSTERLIDLLWGDAPPATERATLQTYVLRLRQLLQADDNEGPSQPILVTRPPGYLLRVGAGELDLHEFDRLVALARAAAATGAHDQAAVRLREALELWRGPALADVASDSLRQVEAPRLEEARLAALEERLDADLALGRHASLVGELESLVANHPLRERLRGQLMLALYRCGRQADALEAYRQARLVLCEEFGLEPEPGAPAPSDGDPCRRPGAGRRGCGQPARRPTVPAPTRRG
jgi:DNA-binding SARP family transcriptional activator